MKRGIGKFSIVSMLHNLRTSRWMAWFAVGAMLGASMLLVRLSLNELQHVQARSDTVSAPLVKDSAEGGGLTLRSLMRSRAQGRAPIKKR